MYLCKVPEIFVNKYWLIDWLIDWHIAAWLSQFCQQKVCWPAKLTNDAPPNKSLTEHTFQGMISVPVRSGQQTYAHGHTPKSICIDINNIYNCTPWHKLYDIVPHENSALLIRLDQCPILSTKRNSYCLIPLLPGHQEHITHKALEYSTN